LAFSKNLIAGAFGRRFGLGGFGPPSSSFVEVSDHRHGVFGRIGDDRALGTDTRP
jgi:hypothetical protein